MRSATKFAVLFLLVMGLAEAGSYVALYALGASSKRFSEIYDPTGNTARVKGGCDDYIQTLELNPYLAYSHNKQCSGQSYRTNNLGLLNQDVDLEHEKFYAIGIFGGSVAAIFAGSNSVPQMEEMLNKCFNSKSGKLFKVLNFAVGDWKQPQQVIALALYGDYVDSAISIEGYNEHWMLRPGVISDIILPPGTYNSLMNDNFFDKYYFILSNIDGISISKSNTIKLFTLLLRRYLEKRGWNSYTKLMEKYAMPNDSNVRNTNIKRYIGFVKSFDAIAKAKNIYSLLVLQPSPLHKKLSSAESKVVTHPLDYEPQYKEITSLIERNSTRFLDLADLFAGYEQTIFSDDIHFVRENDKSFGNYVMSIEIIHRLVADNIVLSNSNSENCVANLRPQLVSDADGLGK